MTREAGAAGSPRARLAAAKVELDEILSTPDAHVEDRIKAVAASVRVALTALEESVGECQVDVPYAPIHMVRLPDGKREWCCSHEPPHCDPV